MKLIIFILLSLFSHSMYCQNTPKGVVYKYRSYDLDKQRYVKNIRTNVYNYINYHRNDWTEYEIEEFKMAYQHFIEIFDDPQKPSRFYTNDLGSIVDEEGELSNIDTTDDFWYDKKGRRINGETYAKLKDKEKRKYHQILANRMVAEYINEIADSMVANNLVIKPNY